MHFIIQGDTYSVTDTEMKAHEPRRCPEKGKDTRTSLWCSGPSPKPNLKFTKTKFKEKKKILNVKTPNSSDHRDRFDHMFSFS